MTLAKTLSAIILATTALATPVAAATITTLADENNAVFFWGQPDTTWYGQTVSFGSDVSLDSFTFRIDDNGTSISYNALVYAWDGDSATGASLFSSSDATTGIDGMTSYSTTTGSLGLTAGDYVLFFEATSNGNANWGSVTGPDTYTDGDFVYQNTSGGFIDIFDPWIITFPTANDLAFSVEYSVAAVPLPAGGLLLLGGLGGLAALRRRKTKKS